jgi:hypothetical protein
MESLKKQKSAIEKALNKIVVSQGTPGMGRYWESNGIEFITDGYFCIIGHELKNIFDHPPQVGGGPDIKPLLEALPKRRNIRNRKLMAAPFSPNQSVTVGYSEQANIVSLKYGDFNLESLSAPPVIHLDNRYMILADILGIEEFSIGDPLEMVHGQRGDGLQILVMPIREGK